MLTRLESERFLRMRNTERDIVGTPIPSLTPNAGGWSERSLPLAMVLLTPWALFQGAPPEVIERAKEEGDDELLDEGGNALEVGSA